MKLEEAKKQLRTMPILNIIKSSPSVDLYDIKEKILDYCHQYDLFDDMDLEELANFLAKEYNFLIWETLHYELGPIQENGGIVIPYNY